MARGEGWPGAGQSFGLAVRTYVWVDETSAPPYLAAAAQRNLSCGVMHSVRHCCISVCALLQIRHVAAVLVMSLKTPNQLPGVAVQSTFEGCTTFPKSA